MHNPEIEQKREKTELVLMNIYNLPPIPKFMTEVINLLSDTTTSVSKLNKVISKDQSLVTKILTIANSPFYGLQRKVSTIEFAILLLGFDELKSIVSTLSMIESFKNKSDKYLNQKEFWQHSFLTGVASKRIADDLGVANSQEAFVGGFLHDLGISVIHRYFHSKFVQIHQLFSEGATLKDAENEVLGLTHAEVGFFLAEKWNFPVDLCDAVLNHHTPGHAKNNAELAATIHVADYMTTRFKCGDFFFDKDLEFDSESMSLLKIESEEKLDEFFAGYENLFQSQLETIRFLN